MNHSWSERSPIIALLLLIGALATYALMNQRAKPQVELVDRLRHESTFAQQPGMTKEGDPEWMGIPEPVQPGPKYTLNTFQEQTSDGVDYNPALYDPPPDTPFFVFGKGIPESLFQTFGSQNKLGVNNELYLQYQNRVDQFTFIGNDNSTREQFIENWGYPFRLADRRWHVTVYDAKTVNAQIRLCVVAAAGVDRDGAYADIDGYSLYELWRLESPGSPPTLLERTHWMLLFEKAKTLAELAQEPNPPQIGAPLIGGVRAL